MTPFPVSQPVARTSAMPVAVRAAAGHLPRAAHPARGFFASTGDRHDAQTFFAFPRACAAALVSGRTQGRANQGTTRQPTNSAAPAFSAQAPLGAVQGSSALTPVSPAKEPVAIPASRAAAPGGSSRRPATRFAGCRRSAETASEAMSRSGWKPRTNPLFGGASKDRDIGNVAAWPLSNSPQMPLLNADWRKAHTATLPGQSRTCGHRPAFFSSTVRT